MLDALPIQTDSECPGLAAVQAEVRELTTPEQRRAVAPDARVTISDRGDAIEIEITREGKTSVRTYRDAARDCDRRAHFASVLVVVSLMPPDLGGAEAEPEPPAAPPEPAPAAPPPPPAAPSVPQPPAAPAASAERSVHLELGARGELSTPISDSVRVALVGGDLRVALGADALRLLLGLGYAPTTRLRYTGETAGRAELRRFDLAVGARYELIHRAIDVSIDANVLFTRSDATGLSAQRPTADTSFSAGGRLGLHAAWGSGQLVPFVSVFATGFPRAPALSQLPQGTVGHLPYVWLGASAGLSLAL